VQVTPIDWFHFPGDSFLLHLEIELETPVNLLSFGADGEYS